MNKIKAILQDEEGNALVTIALMMVVLLGIAALVTDGGRIYFEKSSLQKALDAAVLGGAQVIRTSEAQAISIAKDISNKNSYLLQDTEFATTSDSIKVTSEVNVTTVFARVIGIDSVPVTASAKAIAAPLSKGSGITPIAIEKDDIPYTTELKCDNTGKHSGNCGYLDLSGSGANSLADGILNGSEVTVGEGQTVVTDPGQKWGPVKSAFEELIDRDSGKPHCHSPDTADNECERVIYVVVIDSWDGVTGKDTVNVVGLAAYWLQEVAEPKRVIGQFIKTIAPGEIDPSGGGTDYSLYGVKLVE